MKRPSINLRSTACGLLTATALAALSGCATIANQTKFAGQRGSVAASEPIVFIDGQSQAFAQPHSTKLYGGDSVGMMLYASSVDDSYADDLGNHRFAGTPRPDRVIITTTSVPVD